MTLNIFEQTALSSGFDPIEVVFSRGKDVKYMVCADKDPEREHDIVLFDHNGAAYTLPSLTINVAINCTLNIRSYKDYLSVNGHVSQREPKKDLKFVIP